MRNFRNQERDKLPVLFVHPTVPPVYTSYERRLIACIYVLRAMLAAAEHHRDVARRHLGWSD